MLFQAPELGESELQAIEKIEQVRTSLRHYVHEPRRWFGMLRRTTFARAIRGSNSIEGYRVSVDDAVAAVEGEEPLDAADETWQAIIGYRNAMTYVLQLANDSHFELNETLIRSLHFMMTNYDLRKSPGLWRPGAVYVSDEATNEVVYEAPDADLVPGLMSELAVSLNHADAQAPSIVAAALAHLNLVMIHPFRDGNGRMARGLQTLVLVRSGLLVPQFCSIEEDLGRNQSAYYDVLAEVGQGSWHPENDTRPWLRFILSAHYRQEQTYLRRVRESEHLWDMLERTVAAKKVDDRTIPALWDAANGRRLRNADYRLLMDDEMSEVSAGRDLKVLVQAGLLMPHGEKRGRFYLATDELRELRSKARLPHLTSATLF